MMQRSGFIKVTGSLGLVGIVLGAFGAHGLKSTLSPEMMTVYQTGVFYHLIHTVALLALVLSSDAIWESSPWAKRVCTAWMAGIVIFSGSLYALALSGVGILGAITPFGGLAFILGWGMLCGLRTTQD